MENITVDTAIKKGHQMVNYPLIPVLIVGISLTMYLGTIFQSAWIILLGIGISLSGMWLWWSYMITRWRLWAFSNCRNVHELKRRAINEKLIWPDGSRFEKTEIRNPEQIAQLEIISNKFKIKDEPEIIDDDGSIPDETIIYYSKVSRAVLWILATVILAYAAYLIANDSNLGYFLIVISIITAYQANSKSLSRDPYIILNSKGIKTINTPFTPWSKVKSASANLRGIGKSARWYLDIETTKRLDEDMEISDLGESPKNIDKLIKLYQQRNRKNL